MHANDGNKRSCMFFFLGPGGAQKKYIVKKIIRKLISYPPEKSQLNFNAQIILKKKRTYNRL